MQAMLTQQDPQLTILMRQALPYSGNPQYPAYPNTPAYPTQPNGPNVPVYPQQPYPPSYYPPRCGYPYGSYGEREIGPWGIMG
jgi:hypothetical protein